MIREELAKRKEKARKIITILEDLFPRATIALRYSNAWELLVAVILSAQCTDKKVNEVTSLLFKKYKTLDDYIAASPKEFEQDIRATGFYHNKAKNILANAKIIKENHAGKVPRTMAELLALPGVGRKTANIVLGNAYHVVEGIAVDTHVKRLSKQLGLTDASDPDKIEQDLMQVIPKDKWFKTTYRLIEYGRTFCPAKRHKHEACPLAKL